jgi:hypothetical protein
MAVEAEHIAVAGPSGGGKTTYLRELHARHNGHSVFLTTKSNERKAMHNPPKRLVQSSASYPEDILTARSWSHGRSGTTQIIVDESQNAPTFHGDDGPLRNILHEDRSRGVKAVVATQNPQDWHSGEWNYGPVQQAKRWVWVGPVKDWHRGFFSANGMNDVIPKLPTSDFEYVILNPTASLSPEEKIVYRGETDPQFS